MKNRYFHQVLTYQVPAYRVLTYRILARRVLGIALTAIVLLSAGAGVHADQVPVKSAPHQGYGRLVFPAIAWSFNLAAQLLPITAGPSVH